MNGDVDRLYITRRQGGKGLLQVDQVVREEECAVGAYIRTAQRDDWLMRMVATEHVLETSEDKCLYRQRVTEQRLQAWRDKKLHGQFQR